MKRITLSILVFAIFLLPGAISASVFYLDPEVGSLENDGSAGAPWPGLQKVIEANLVETYEYSPLPYDPLTSQLVIKYSGAPVKAGDTLMLLSGLHGQVEIDRHYNLDFITILAAEGHTPILSGLHFRSCQNWQLEGIHISSEPYGYYTTNELMLIESVDWGGPASDIQMLHCNLYSGTNSWDWSAENWQERSRDGIFIIGDRILVRGNILTNVAMGITIVGDSCNIINNQIVNFSGDGIRPLGTHLLVEGNLIKNCFVVDDNHDDGIQAFNLGIYTPHNVTIRGNAILNYEDPDQPLLGPLQGIGCFGGPYNNWVVENNIVSVNHWHGITLLGGYDCLVVNNTVLDPTPGITPGGSWIMIDDQQDGTPSAGCIVKNNVANQILVDGETSNNVVLTSQAQYDEHFVNYTTYDFHLLPTSELIDQADDAYAPPFDFDGIMRPQGTHSDIGAYEYSTITTTTQSFNQEEGLEIYPNPFENILQVEINSDRLRGPGEIRGVNIYGEIVFSQWVIPGQDVYSLNLSFLERGIYFVSLNGFGYQKVIKL